MFIPVIFKLLWVFWIPVTVISFIIYFAVKFETDSFGDPSPKDFPINSLGYIMDWVLCIIMWSGIFCSVVIPVVYYLYCLIYGWVVWMVKIAEGV